MAPGGLRRGSYFNFRKFFRICRPFSVRMLSGWNCTPQIGILLVLHAHDFALVGLGGDLQTIGH